MENVIYTELVRRGYSVDVGVVEIEHNENGVRELRQHEIDFIVNTGSKKIYIQSAYGMDDPSQAKREKLPLMRTGDVFSRMIITGGRISRNSGKPIRLVAERIYVGTIKKGGTLDTLTIALLAQLLPKMTGIVF